MNDMILEALKNVFTETQISAYVRVREDFEPDFYDENCGREQDEEEWTIEEWIEYHINDPNSRIDIDRITTAISVVDDYNIDDFRIGWSIVEEELVLVIAGDEIEDSRIKYLHSYENRHHYKIYA